MMKGRLRIGLIGLGRLGRHYVEYFVRIRNAKLIAVADIDEAALKSVAADFDVPHLYADYHDLIANKDLDAVVIAVSTSMHREIILESAKAGKAIFCEKPLTLSLQEGEEIKKVIEETGVFFHMGLMRRFDPGYAAAKQKIQHNEIGSPVLFRATSRDPYPPGLEYLKISGGIFVDMGIHDFDLARWFMGEVKSIFSQGGVLACPELKELGDIDNAVITITFENGALGMIDLTRNGVYGYDVRAEIIGTTGTIKVGYLRETPIELMKKEGVSHDAVPFFMERFKDAYLIQLQDFVGNILTEQAPSITCADGVEALRIAIAARRSFEENRPIQLKQIN